MKFLLLAILIFEFIMGCVTQQSNTEPEQLSKEQSQTPLDKEDEYSFLDTAIVVSDNGTLLMNDENLDSTNSEKILYDHFRNKDVLPRKELLIRSTIYTGEENVDYDTVYKIQSKELSVLVISYWQGPTDLNGHCFQPKKAIIQKTKNGIKITNEEFIPTSFAIDSTKSNFIYGHEFECVGRGNLRQFRIELR